MSHNKSANKQELSTEPSTSSFKGVKRKAWDGDESEYLRRKHNFIRSTIRTDYQPDICKDYKETGFCGFGDSCKFLHDRSDYKHGWQLDQDWAKGEYKDEDDDKYLIKDEDEDEGGLSSECVICKKPYKDPIETKCKHYFCIDCAEKECSDKCYVCEKSTQGIFKNATKLLQKLISDQSTASPKSDKCVSDEDDNDKFDDYYE